MAIKSISDITSRGGWSIEGGRTYTVVVQVETDHKHVGSSAVLAALNLFTSTTYRYPMVEASTESDERCFLSSVDLTRTDDDDGRQWRATLEFRPWNPAQDPRGPIDESGNRNPFDAPPVLRSRGEAVEQGVPYDRNGVAILNSAGDPYEDAPAIEEPLVVFEVSRIERSFDATLITSIQGHINDDEWLGFEAGSILCRSIASTRTWNQDVQGWAWETVYEFAYRPSIVGLTQSGIKVRPGWRFCTYDRGFRMLDGDEKVTILDSHGVALDAPSNLDGSGGVLAAGDEPVQKSYDIWPAADFSALAFPPDLFTAATPEA